MSKLSPGNNPVEATADDMEAILVAAEYAVKVDYE
jgi:hypothetical protein